jgi:ABC-type histidine transport system ATPase subunit
MALLDIVRDGVGVLMISHHLEFLKTYATRVDFLNDGVIAATGRPSEMLENPVHPALRQFVEGVRMVQ